MGEAIIIYGRSGSGKSRSLINFKEDELFVVQTIKKRLPFRKEFKYTMVSRDVNRIIDQLKKMPLKAAVIDDAGYILTGDFMDGHRNKSGSSSFDLYNDIADHFWKLINAIKELPDDVFVYLMMHEDTNDYGDTKLRTIGKLLNDKVCIEGMCTIVLRCKVENETHIFKTQCDGSDISKSPEGMFDLEIPNDLKAVDVAIREYYGLIEKPKKKKEEENVER